MVPRELHQLSLTPQVGTLGPAEVDAEVTAETVGVQEGQQHAKHRIAVPCQRKPAGNRRLTFRCELTHQGPRSIAARAVLSVNLDCLPTLADVEALKTQIRNAKRASLLRRSRSSGASTVPINAFSMRRFNGPPTFGMASMADNIFFRVCV